MFAFQRLNQLSVQSQWFNMCNGLARRYLSNQVATPIIQEWPQELTKLFDEAVKQCEDKQYGKSLRRVWKILQRYPDVRNDHDILRLRAQILCERDDLARFPGTEGSLFFPKFSHPNVSTVNMAEEEDNEPGPSLKDITNHIFVSNFGDDELLLLSSSKRLLEDYSPKVRQERVILNEADAKKKYYKGIAYYITGEWEKAQRVFKDVAHVIPEAKLKEGHSFLLLGQPENAIKAYNEVLIKAPEVESEAFAGIACAYLEQGLLDKAGEAI